MTFDSFLLRPENVGNKTSGGGGLFLVRSPRERLAKRSGADGISQCQKSDRDTRRATDCAENNEKLARGNSLQLLPWLSASSLQSDGGEVLENTRLRGI